MAKMKNQRIYSNREHLLMLEDEVKNYIGRQYRLDLAEGCLTIFALPQRKRKETKGSDLPREKRDKREEKFERRAG